MLGDINQKFNEEKRRAAEDQFIGEAAMEVEEVIPGSEEEIDEVIDADSVPDETYKKVDKALDDLLSKEGYDDTEVEELVDGEGETAEVDENEITDEELDRIVNEACDNCGSEECDGCGGEDADTEGSTDANEMGEGDEDGENQNPEGDENPDEDEKETGVDEGESMTESASPLSLLRDLAQQ